MGILVNEAMLPSGIILSNVYMSFSNEMIYTHKPGNVYNVNSYYRIYNTKDKLPDIPIRFPINIVTSNIEVNVYTILYDELKKMYPNSVDVLDQVFIYPTNIYVDPDAMTSEERDRGMKLLGDVYNYLQLHPENVELQEAYTVAQDKFGHPGAATAEIGTLELLWEYLLDQ